MNRNNNHIAQPVVPKGWNYIPFGEVFEFIQSKALSRDELTTEITSQIVYNIHYGDIHATYESEILDFEKESRIPKIKNISNDNSDFEFIKEGDLIIADASEDYEGVGSCIEVKNLNRRKATGGLHTFVARDNNGFTIPGFRPYIFKHPFIGNELKKLATGSKVFGISKTNLSTLLVLIPEKNVQHEIVKSSTLFNIAIKKQKLLIEIKQDMKNALMQQLLNGIKRFPKYKGRWNFVHLRDVANIRRGASPRPINNKDFFAEKGRGWIRIEDVTASEIYLSKTKQYLSELGASKSVEVNPGDFIMSICGTIGVPRIIAIPACVHDGFVVISKFEKRLDKYFLYHYINHIAEELIHSGQPGIQRNLNTTIVGEIEVPDISLEEQRQIASLFNSCEKEIVNLKLILKDLIEQKKAIIQQILSNQIKVKK